MSHRLLKFVYSAWGTYGHATYIIMTEEEDRAFELCREKEPNKKLRYHNGNLSCGKWASYIEEPNTCEYEGSYELEEEEAVSAMRRIIHDHELYRKVIRWMKKKLPVFYRLHFAISGDEECQQECLLTREQYRLYKKKEGYTQLFLPCGWDHRFTERIFHIEDGTLLSQGPLTELDTEIHRWLQEDDADDMSE